MSRSNWYLLNLTTREKTSTKATCILF